jgi:hypothetical protein
MFASLNITPQCHFVFSESRLATCGKKTLDPLYASACAFLEQLSDALCVAPYPAMDAMRVEVTITGDGTIVELQMFNGARLVPVTAYLAPETSPEEARVLARQKAQTVRKQCPPFGALL